jgi:hypothetical protein
MKELSTLTPESFGIMYCLDLFWKLLLVRLEHLLDSEDAHLGAIKSKLELNFKK